MSTRKGFLRLLTGGLLGGGAAAVVPILPEEDFEPDDSPALTFSRQKPAEFTEQAFPTTVPTGDEVTIAWARDGSGLYAQRWLREKSGTKILLDTRKIV